MKFHPLADLFPLIEGADFDDLVEDIRQHGVREPIWTFKGQLLDGRNRWRAAESVGADCPVREYLGDDPLGFVLSLNLKRRHLTESQRAMVAAALANMHHGGDRKSPIGDSIPQEQTARLLKVGKRSVERAGKVQTKWTPALQKAVEAGNIAVSAAARAAGRPAGRNTSTPAWRRRQAHAGGEEGAGTGNNGAARGIHRSKKS